MADWYLSSAAYATYTAFQTSHAYTVGNIIKPTAPANFGKWVYRCTTAGTSTTEPNWNTASNNNNTVASGGATFTNITGQSAFGWTAAAGDFGSLMALSASARFFAGDRVFVSSDHSESIANTEYLGAGFSATAGFAVGQVLSVNRTGSTPPVAADLTPGATFTCTGNNNVIFESAFPVYHWGLSFVYGGTNTSAFIFNNAGSSTKTHYFDNCQFLFNGTANSTMNASNAAAVIFDNTTVQFGAATQSIQPAHNLAIEWRNTASAVWGAVPPTSLFVNSSFNAAITVACRGIDLSTITGSLVNYASPNNNNGGMRFLFDSCRLNPSVTRMAYPNIVDTWDIAEFVNCSIPTLSQAQLGVHLGTYLGGGAGSYASVNAHWTGFKTAMNRTPTIVGAILINSYQFDTTPPSGWGGDISNWTAASLPVDGSVAPFLGMAMTNTSSTDTDYSGWSAGTYDTYFQNALALWKALGITKVYIRVNWEFNINLVGWGVPSSGQVTNWVAAYKHICNTAHSWGAANGVTVKMVWSPSVSWQFSNAQSFNLPVINFFPTPDGSAVGGKYIDVIGPDLYMNGYSRTSFYHDGYNIPLAINTTWSMGTFVRMAETYGCAIGLSESGDGSSFDSNNSATDGVLAGAMTYLNGCPVPIDYVMIFDVSAGGATQFTNGGSSNMQSGWRCALGVGGTQPNSSLPIPALMSTTGNTIVNESYQPPGFVITEFSATLLGGAQDNVGNYSHKMTSNANIDKFVNVVNSFWMDVNYTTLGASKTATVEILGAPLNNDDVSLWLEYEGTSGSSLASFNDSFIATPLSTSTSVASSTASWNNVPTTSLTIWNIADSVSTTLSGFNLTETPTAQSGIRSNTSISSGKAYFEIAFLTGASSGAGVGIANGAASMSSVITTGSGAAICNGFGNISVNGSAQTGVGSFTSGGVCCIAVDMGAKLVWFRNGAAGNWNGSGTANPATGTGGYSFSGLTGGASTIFAYAGGTSSGAGGATANFGASTFVGAIPSGYGGFSLTPMTAQKLQVSFTPQATGRLRGQVRLGRPGTTVYINPQIRVS